MKNALLAFGLTLVSLPAFAEEYTCESAKKDISAWLVFDDGPGGLDAERITIEGKEIEDIRDRDSIIGTYNYASDSVEIGWTSKAGDKIDLLANQENVDADSDTFVGLILVQKAGESFGKSYSVICNRH